MKQAIEEGTKEAQRMPEVGPLVEVLKSVKTTTEDKSITLEATASTDVPLVLIQLLLKGVGGQMAQPVPSK